jgi:hypothetical protein
MKHALPIHDSAGTNPVTDIERHRMVIDLSGQGVVYAIALVAVLVMFLLAEIWPIYHAGSPGQGPVGREPTELPGTPGP